MPNPPAETEDTKELNCPKCYGRRWHFIWCPDAQPTPMYCANCGADQEEFVPNA